LGEKSRNQFTPRIIGIVTEKVDDKKMTRLALLNTMYNLDLDPAWRSSIFTALLEYALKSNQASLVDGISENIDERMKEWNSTSAQKRNIYDLIVSLLGDQNSAEVYDIWMRYIASFEEDPKSFAESKERVKSIIISVIKDPEILQTDRLFDLKAVQQLKNDPNYDIAYRLLHIFTLEGYKEYNEFYNQNTAFFSNEGLDHQKLSTKIRLLTLNSLASKHDAFSYDQLAKALEIDESEVEMIVIDAIVSDIIDVRLDQSEKQIIVRRVESRVFNINQWETLNRKVEKWKENMKGLLDVIHNARGPYGLIKQ